jgi:hypothetical protein
MAQMTYDGLNHVVQKTQPAPPLAKMTPLKALKPSRLSSKIASASINDQELLKQNDKVGIQNRKKSQTPKIMTKLENEIVRDFELSEPPGFTVIDPETGIEVKRKFNIEGIDPPDIDRDPAGVVEAFYDRLISPDEAGQIFRRLDIEKDQDLQVYRDYLLRKEELEEQLKELTIRLNRAGSIAIPQIRQEIIQLEGQIGRLRIAMNRTARNIDTNYDNQTQQIQEVIAEHNALVLAKKQRNSESIKQYQAQLNLLNSGAFKTEKAVNETEEEYLERLRQNAEEVIPEQQLEQAENRILIEFRKLLQEITKDAVKIDQIANSLSPEDKYQLIKIWKLVKEKYNRAYGITNKGVDAETIIAFFNGLIHGAEESSQLPSAVQNVISQISEGGAEIFQEGELIITPEIGSNQIIIQKSNIAGQPPLFIRVLHENPRRIDGLYQILYSFTGEVGSFKMFLPILHRPVPLDRRPLNKKGEPSNRGGNSDTEIKEKTGITTGDLNKLVGFDKHAFNASLVAKKLVEKYHIIPFKPNEEGVNHRKYGTYGARENDRHDEYGMGLSKASYGIAKANEPKLVQFGNIMISLPNLKYKNILSVRTHLGKTMGGTPNVKISAKLSSIILNLLEHIQPTHDEINRLSSYERQLYDRIVYLGRLHTKLPQTNDKSINELKKRLKLLEGEINIGNNSPQIYSEIKQILYTLRDFNVITPKQLKDYLTKNSI